MSIRITKVAQPEYAQASCGPCCLSACLHSAAAPPSSRRRSATTTDVPPLPDPPSLAEDRRGRFTFRRPGRQPRAGKKGATEADEPVARIETANDAARVEPRQDGYFNAVQVFPFSPGRALSGLCRARTDHRYRARGRRAAHGFRTGRGRRHRALGRRRYRKRKWRHQTRPYLVKPTRPRSRPTS